MKLVVAGERRRGIEAVGKNSDPKKYERQFSSHALCEHSHLMGISAQAFDFLECFQLLDRLLQFWIKPGR